MDITTRFCRKVKVGAEHECWPWTAGTTPNGYGKFHVHGAALGAHRVSFWLEHGRWPEPMALHRCGNKACVNPTHIYEGDSKDNYVDSLNSGTAVHGEAHHMAKLRARDVRRIRELIAGTPATSSEIARAFDITPQLVSAIKHGRAWRNVT